MGTIEREQKLQRQLSTSTPAVGDVVLVFDECPRSNWKLGLKVQLIPGGDGQIRAATVRINNTNCTRAIYKLYPLEGLVGQLMSN